MRNFAPCLVFMLLASLAFNATAQTTPPLLTESLRIGRGAVLDVEWHSSGEMVLVDTILGAWIYDDLLQDVAHVPDIRLATFSPNGTLLAGVNTDFTIGLWETETFTEVARLAGHTAEITALEWSPDGTLLASAGRDERLLLWDAAARTIAVDVLAGKLDLLKWSPRGTRIGAIDRENQTLRVWDADGELVLAQRQTFGFPYSIPPYWWGISWRDESQILVWSAGESDTSSALWDIAANAILNIDIYSGRGISFSPDGSRMLAVSPLWGGIVVDLNEGQIAAYLSHNAIASAWAHDGRRVTVADYRVNPASIGYIFIADILTGRKQYAPIDTYRINELIWSADDQRLLSLGDEGELAIWDTATITQLASSNMHTLLRNGDNAEPIPLAWSTNGEKLAIADELDAIHVWDSASGTRLITLSAAQKVVVDIVWQPGGTLLAAILDHSHYLTREIYLWDTSVQSEQRLTVIPQYAHPESLSWHPDGSVLLVTGGNQLTTWQASTRTIYTVELTPPSVPIWNQTENVYGVQWTADGSLFGGTAWIDGKSFFTVWNADTMTRIQPDTELMGQYEPDDAWRWTSDGSMIYVVSTSPPPELHYSVIYASASERQQGQSIVLASMNGYSHQIALHPDGYYVVGIDIDDVGFLWDVRSPDAPIFTFHDILHAEWSPDGTLLAVLRNDGTALIYNTATLEITAQFAATPEATLYWSPDSRRIARHDSGTVFIYDLVG